MKYKAGDTRILRTEQTDDDDGEKRITPAGALVEIYDVIEENPDNPYAVGCPDNGASWYFSEAELESQTTPVPEPNLVGIWVLGCSSQGEFIQWGRDGGTGFPFPPDQMDEAIAQARYVSESDRQLRLCLLNVFDNGQIRQDEYTGE